MSNNGHRRCRQGDGGALPGTNDTRARRGGVGCIASGAPHVWRRRGERPGVEEKSEPPQCGVSICVSWLGLDWVLSDCSISILCKEARSLTRLHHSSCRDEMASCPLDQAAKLLTTDRPPNHDGILPLQSIKARKHASALRICMQALGRDLPDHHLWLHLRVDRRSDCCGSRRTSRVAFSMHNSRLAIRLRRHC